MATARAMTMRYEPYSAVGGREWMLVIGPADGPQVLIVPPLFEELNFTRAVMTAMARLMAGRGIGAWIMDLPGAGESMRSIDEVALPEMRAAVAAAARAIAADVRVPHIAAIRGGALLDDAATALSWWRFAPAAGAALLRQMERAQAIGDKESGRVPDAAGEHVDLIGYRLNRALRDALRTAQPAVPGGALREVAFDGPGAAPWRRAEPTPDAALSARLATDIADWIAACGA